MGEEAQKVINEYTGKRIDRLEDRMGRIENKVDILETLVITIDTKIDSQSTMLQMLIEGQEESKKSG